MSLETGVYISDLNTSNPTAGDPKSQGDDHLRLEKTVLLNTFPNITGAMNATHTELNRLVGSASLVVDRAYVEYAGNDFLSATIPYDDTIPQVTEGTGILTVSITPKSITNRLRVKFQCFGSVENSSDVVIAALFNQTSANALAASVGPASIGVGALVNCVLEYEYVPATTTTQILSIRVGGAVGTVHLNGTTSARRFGGVAKSTLVVEELTS